MRRLFTLTTLLVGLCCPALAQAGCTAYWDAGAAATYAHSTMSIDTWKGGANCTTTNGNDYETYESTQEYFAGTWHDIESYGQPGVDFTNTTANKKWRFGLAFGSTGYGQDFIDTPCSWFSAPQLLTRSKLMVENEDTGSESTAYSKATRTPAACRTLSTLHPHRRSTR